MFRPAREDDLPAVAAIYEAIHDQEAQGLLTTGWLRGIYPVADTAGQAFARGELYVAETDGRIAAAAIINQLQPEAYADGAWRFPAPEVEILVLHTLAVAPDCAGRGIGSGFVQYYEHLAARKGCRALRMDTNARNKAARRLYARLGYQEAGVVPCAFNGIPDVRLVLLEKEVRQEA